MFWGISCWAFDDDWNMLVAQSISSNSSFFLKAIRRNHEHLKFASKNIIPVISYVCFSLSNYNQVTLEKCMFNSSKTRSHPSYSKCNIFFSQNDHKEKIADRHRQLAIYGNRPIYKAGYILDCVYRLLTRCDYSWGQLLKPVRLVSAVYNYDRPGSRKDSWL